MMKASGSLEENVPDPQSPEVLYLKPGIHRPQEIIKTVSSVNPMTGKEPDIIFSHLECIISKSLS